MLKRSIIQLIKKYQICGGGKVLFGIDCNYSPSCSEYMKICITQYGLIFGISKGIKRILRCNNRDLVDTIIDEPIN